MILTQQRCEMKFCDDLKAEMETMQLQMVEAKKNENVCAKFIYCWDAEVRKKS